jgi:DNA gyrase subunit A
VRPHQELVFISQEGMVQRTNVRGIRQTGRPAQGVTLMNVRDDDRVSAVALVVESDSSTAASVTDSVTEADVAAGPVELSADSGEIDGVVEYGGGAEHAERNGGQADGAGADGAAPDDEI